MAKEGKLLLTELTFVVAQSQSRLLDSLPNFLEALIMFLDCSSSYLGVIHYDVNNH